MLALLAAVYFFSPTHSPGCVPPAPVVPQKLCPYAEALEENWGKPPGNLNSNGQELLIYGKQFGNVFIGVQPSFGYEGDPMRLLFSRSASPHHGFAAYYTYVEKIFGVRWRRRRR